MKMIFNSVLHQTCSVSLLGEDRFKPAPPPHVQDPVVNRDYSSVQIDVFVTAVDLVLRDAHGIAAVEMDTSTQTITKMPEDVHPSLWLLTRDRILTRGFGRDAE